MYQISDWRQNADEVIVSVSLVPSIGLISNVGHRSEGVSVLSWIHDFVKLPRWVYVPSQLTKSYGHVITQRDKDKQGLKDKKNNN